MFKDLILKLIGIRRRDNTNYVKYLKGASPGVTSDPQKVFKMNGCFVRNLTSGVPLGKIDRIESSV